MDSDNQIIIYQSVDGETRIEVKFTGETVWLSQQQMAELYQTARSNVVEHIKHIYEDGEFVESTGNRAAQFYLDKVCKLVNFAGLNIPQ